MRVMYAGIMIALDEVAQDNVKPEKAAMFLFALADLV